VALRCRFRVHTATIGYRVNVRNWALADWQLSRPISSGRLLGTMDAREGPERQKMVASGQAAFSGEAW